MEIQPDQTQPDDPENLSPARRRRARRRLVSALSTDERAAFLEDATRRASPSFDFFIFSLLGAAIISVGLLIDSPYLLLLGVLLAPLMAPVIGISLGTVLGSVKTFGNSLGGFLVGCLIVIVVGALAGFVSQIWPEQEFLQAHLQAQLTWPPFLVLAVGAILTSATLVRDKFNPAIPSVAIAYGLYLPLSSAGFGLGSGVPFLWPDGLVVFTVHLTWIVLLGAATLAVMGFRPHTLFGYSLGGVVTLLGIILAIGAGGAGAVAVGGIAQPTPTPTITETLTPTASITPSPVPPTATFTATITETITLTPTNTSSPTPTPVQALIRAQTENEIGVVIRQEPGGVIISSLLNGAIVIILPGDPVLYNGANWVRVLDLENNLEGWVLSVLVVTATPSGPIVPLPPSETPVPTIAVPTNTPPVSPTP